ncbi:hypothetical protein CEP53_006690 [Fusarium sp. AF-6]|nr:hypothetical protein CEP53_006690 [Fusarium sp. AF-6]
MARICIPKSPSRAARFTDAGPTRVRVACDACRTQKLKCTGSQPCPRCENSGRECCYTANSGKNRGVNAHVSASGPTADNDEGDEGGDSPSVVASLTSAATSAIRPPASDVQMAHVNTTTPGPCPEGNNPSSITLAPPEDHLEASDLQRQDAGSSRTAASPIFHDSTPSIAVTGTTGQMIPTQELQPQFDRMEGVEVHIPTPPLQSSASLPFDPTESAFYSKDLGFWLDSIPFDNNMFDLFPFADSFSTQHHVIPDSLLPYTQAGDNLEGPIFDALLTAGPQSGLVGVPEIAEAMFPSLNSDASRWLTTRPSLSNFDHVIVNRFINLFVMEVPETFISFKNFHIKWSTNEEEVLAVAAFGGLYSTTQGSHVIARAMCSDSRRLLLTRIQTNFPVEPERKISLLRTLILLESFGICSGDKRLCELSEAFHIQFLQILSRSSAPSGPEGGPDHNLQSRVLHDFQVLECYRTTLLQWPPYLYPGMSIFGSIQPATSSSRFGLNRPYIIDTTRALLSPTGPSVDLNDPYVSSSALAALLVLSSHASASKHSDSQLEEGLWDKRFFELGLNNWLRYQGPSGPSGPMLVLFYMGIIVLHTNFAKVHRLVRAYCIQTSSLPATISLISQWRESEDCEVAVMHANRLLDIVAKLCIYKSSHPTQPMRTALEGQDQRGNEAPHLAICVYLAAITAWAASVSEKPSSLDVARTVLSRACRILRRLNLRAANGFEKILRCLEEKCNI